MQVMEINIKESQLPLMIFLSGGGGRVIEGEKMEGNKPYLFVDM